MSKDEIMEMAVDNGYRVRIKCTNGITYIGVADGYISADDEENGKPSITILPDDVCRGFGENDIESIEILDNDGEENDDSVFNLITPHMCPVCGKTEFPQYYSYDICDECGWEDDMIKDTDITCNDLDLPAFRARYEKEGHPAWLDELDDDEE